MSVQLHHGDCLDVLRAMPENSVDSIVTDPPYGLSFMGRRWDYDVPGVEVWAECLRVLKPGGHLLAFAGTRTQHRMAVRIEDAGFEIRDMIAWVYGSGFPKSLDVSKAIDKARRRDYVQVALDMGLNLPGRNVDDWTKEGHAPGDKWWSEFKAALPPETWQAIERRVIGSAVSGQSAWFARGVGDVTAPATEAARQWQGWGTALKPALETVTFASKPYTDEQVRDIIQSNLFRLETRLWLLSSANAAGKSSTSNPSEYGAVCAIAQWNADEITSTRADLCDQMGTSLFELATTTSLNIVSSWRHTLTESWSDGNTYTTKTKSSMTIDWRTLKFSVSQITPASIIRACSLPGGFSVNATTAESHFNASLSLLQSIRTLSATERAMSQVQHEHQGAGVKPNLDPCIMARKPLGKGMTVAVNVLEWGTGAINVDACRVPLEEDCRLLKGGTYGGNRGSDKGTSMFGTNTKGLGYEVPSANGRWPANLIHDGSTDVVSLFPQSAGQQGDVRGTEPSSVTNGIYGDFAGRFASPARNDTGSAARFFYCAKASRADRNDGVEHLDKKPLNWSSGTQNQGSFQSEGTDKSSQNNHPTVKPTDLMAYLCRLVTPAGGIVLDPFMGSGTTAAVAIQHGRQFLGCELNSDYWPLQCERIAEARRAVAERAFADRQLDLLSALSHPA